VKLQQNKASVFVPVFTAIKSELPIGGTVSVSYLFGAEVTTTVGASAKPVYTIVQNVLEEVTVTVSNELVDTSAFPLLHTPDGFEGTWQVRLDNAKAGYAQSLNFNVREGVETIEATEILEGDSYLRYCTDWLFGRLDSGGSNAVYSEGLRNSDCWLASEDLTGIPFSNSNSGAQKNGGLITRRHVLGVLHFPLGVGNTITWKTSDNTTVTRSIIGVSTITADTGDALMYVLNADVPVGIKVYPVVGRWLFVKEETSVFTLCNQFVLVFVDQNRNAGYVRVVDPFINDESKKSFTLSGISVSNVITTIRFDAWFTPQVTPEFSPYETVRVSPKVGDSGSALFAKVESGLALASVFTSFQSGPFADEDFMNALIVSADTNARISTGYTVTVAPDPTL